MPLTTADDIRFENGATEMKIANGLSMLILEITENYIYIYISTAFSVSLLVP